MLYKYRDYVFERKIGIEGVFFRCKRGVGSLVKIMMKYLSFWNILRGKYFKLGCIRKIKGIFICYYM